jgi:RND family efflux transporter MFP subunit
MLWSTAFRFALALISIGSIGCSRSPYDPPTNAQKSERLETVKVVHPIRRKIAQSITLTATVEAFAQVPLYAKIAGYVSSINVDIGDRVKQGQLLAVLEMPEVEQQYAEAKAQVAERKARVVKAEAEAELQRITFARSSGLRAKDAITQQDMDQAQATYRTAEAQVQLTRAQENGADAHLRELQSLIAYSRITSPVDGIVTRRFVDPGALMPAATSSNSVTPIVIVARDDLLRVFADVPEAEAAHIKIGENASLVIPATPNHEFKGSVTRFANALDTSSRTMRTEVDLPNPNGALKPGAYGQLTIHLDSHPDGLTVPRAALHRDNDGSFVFVVEKGHAVRRNVNLGIVSDDHVEILSGLNPGNQVAVGGDNLENGIRVRVMAEAINAGSRESR